MPDLSIVKPVVKPVVDTVANTIKTVEETLDPSAVVLPHFKRSLQLDGYSCGLQATSMILRYFGVRIGMRKLARELHLTHEGTSLSNIKRVLKVHGLKYKSKRHAKLADIYRAIDAGHPVIASTLENWHWTCVYGYSDEHIYVADPSAYINACVRVRKTEFRRQWDRAMLEIRKPTG